MDGEARFVDARKMGTTGGWTRIREGMRRRKRKVDRQKKEQFLVSKKELVG
jgi:hypothetical protein